MKEIEIKNNYNKCTRIENCKKSENENKCLEYDEYFCLDVKKTKMYIK